MIRPATKALMSAAALALMLSGCGFPKGADEKAEMFFDKGSDKITDSLSDQGVDGEQMAEVESIIADHRERVVPALSQALSERKASFKTLYTGQDTATMLSAADQAHEARRKALKRIGAMHAEIESAVGSDTWAAANTQRREDFEDHFEDD